MLQRLACVTLLALLFLPFVNKAIHIDDVAFLRLGDYFGWNPLQSFPHDYPYQGQAEPLFSAYDATHPLLIPYLLKGLQALFGPAEVPLHLAFMVFPALALWSLVRLARALGDGTNPLPLLVLFGSVPAFVVNGQNLMTDVPTLAFLLAGTAVVAERVQAGDAGSPWWGSLWLGCAVFSSYQALVFVPVLAAFVLAGMPPGALRRRLVLAVLLPAAALLVWLLLVYAVHGVFPLLGGGVRVSVGSEVTRGLQWPVLWPKAIFILAMTGASLAFVLPVRFCLSGAVRPLRAGCVLLGLSAAVFVLAPAESGGLPSRLALAGFGALGLFGLGLAGRELGRWHGAPTTRGMAILCGGWLGMSLLVALVALPFGSARYLLPLLPVLFFVLLRGSASCPPRLPRLGALLLLGAIAWGGLNAWADYTYAGTYRTMAAELAEFRRSLDGDRRIWYIGEWGMRHYFDRAGARYLLAASTEPQPGDFVVIPEMPRFWAPAPELRRRLDFYASREFRSPLPLRLFSRRSGAGFYCHHWGMLPLTFSSAPDEVFVIQEVR